MAPMWYGIVRFSWLQTLWRPPWVSTSPLYVTVLFFVIAIFGSAIGADGCHSAASCGPGLSLAVRPSAFPQFHREYLALVLRSLWDVVELRLLCLRMECLCFGFVQVEHHYELRRGRWALLAPNTVAIVM